MLGALTSLSVAKYIQFPVFDYLDDPSATNDGLLTYASLKNSTGGIAREFLNNDLN